MRKLQFAGIVSDDTDTSSEAIVFLGRDDLLVAPEDWPTALAPGTLSIDINGFPDSFAEIGDGEGLAKLDQGRFRAALVIPQRKIIGNTLKPDVDHPTRGFAQVWRAHVRLVDTGQASDCWMLRIIGSGVGNRLELVAEESLRDCLGVCDGTPVNVTVWEAQSDWQPPTPDEIIADWCEAARNVEGAFGPEKAMGYLVGEKFLNFLEAAETNAEWRQAIPLFVGEIKTIFERWQLAEYLEVARLREPFDAHLYDEDDDPEQVEEERQADIRCAANDLLLVERAKEWLLEEES